VSRVYIFLAHRLPEQLGRLVSALYHPDDLFLVHIDAKVRSAPFVNVLNQRLGAAPNVEYVKPVRCDWAGFGHLKATLRALDHAANRAPAFTHAVLLTGQDYPIKPAGTIRSYLDANRERSFISWSAGDDASQASERRGNLRWYWDGDLRRLTVRHYPVRGRWVHVPNRFVPFFPPQRIPSGWRPYQGLAYWCLSSEAVAYVRRLLATRPNVIRSFRRMFVPDEFFFQMALLNSPLKPTLVNDDLRHMTWVDYHPATIRSSDLQELEASPKLFARKFDMTVDAEILELVDSTLL
jgi:core-2/I-Branching enzyme